MDRMTRKNPNGTYRLPMNAALSVRTEWQMEMPVMFGAPIDRLGEYEEIGTPREFAMLKAMYGTKKIRPMYLQIHEPVTFATRIRYLHRIYHPGGGKSRF